MQTRSTGARDLKNALNGVIQVSLLFPSDKTGKLDEVSFANASARRTQEELSFKEGFSINSRELITWLSRAKTSIRAIDSL